MGKKRIKASKGKILVADDDPFIRELLSSEIESRGYDCDTTDCVEEAKKKLSLAQKEGESYDLVATDIKMPTYSEGLDLAKYINDSFRDIPVIGMSALDDIEIVRGLFRAGVTSFGNKPDTIEETKSFVQREFISRTDRVRKLKSLDSEKRFAEILGPDRILVMDSEQDIKNISHKIFKGDYKVNYARCEADTLRLLRQERYKVLVLKNSSVMSSVSFAKLISGTYPFLRIVYQALNSEELTQLNDVVFDFFGRNTSHELIAQRIGCALADSDTFIRYMGGVKSSGIIITGAQGTGKTTIQRALENIVLSKRIITDVERAPRPGEKEGVDHYFQKPGHIQSHHDDYVFTYQHKKGYDVGIKSGLIEEQLIKNLDPIIIVANPLEVKNAEKAFWDNYGKTLSIKKICLFSDPSIAKNRRIRRGDDPGKYLMAETMTEDALLENTLFEMVKNTETQEYDLLIPSMNYSVEEVSDFQRELDIVQTLRKIVPFIDLRRYDALRKDPTLRIRPY